MDPYCICCIFASAPSGEVSSDMSSLAGDVVSLRFFLEVVGEKGGMYHSGIMVPA